MKKLSEIGRPLRNFIEDDIEICFSLEERRELVRRVWEEKFKAIIGSDGGQWITESVEDFIKREGL